MNRKLHLIPLDERRDTHLSQLCHKAIHDKPEHSLRKFFTRIQNINNRNTRRRNQMQMMLPDRRSSKGRLGFAYRGPMHWNKLSNDMKLITNYTKVIVTCNYSRSKRKTVHNKILLDYLKMYHITRK